MKKWDKFKSERTDIVVQFLRAKKKKTLAETIMKLYSLYHTFKIILKQYEIGLEYRRWELRQFWVTLKMTIKFKRMITRRGGGMHRKIKHYLKYGFNVAALFYTA